MNNEIRLIDLFIFYRLIPKSMWFNNSSINNFVNNFISYLNNGEINDNKIVPLAMFFNENGFEVSRINQENSFANENNTIKCISDMIIKSNEDNFICVLDFSKDSKINNLTWEASLLKYVVNSDPNSDIKLNDTIGYAITLYGDKFKVRPLYLHGNYRCEKVVDAFINQKPFPKTFTNKENVPANISTQLMEIEGEMKIVKLHKQITKLQDMEKKLKEEAVKYMSESNITTLKSTNNLVQFQYSPSQIVTKKEFDVEKFKNDYPDLYEKYCTFNTSTKKEVIKLIVKEI